MSNISKMQKAHQEKSLNTLVNTPDGIITKKQWMDKSLLKGWYVEIGQKNKVQYNRKKYNRMSLNEQEEYEKKCNEKVTCYQLFESKSSRTYFEISKSEYDYFIKEQAKQGV